MDERRFDSVARQLVSGSSRRQAIKRLAGAGLAVVLARAGLEEVAAGKKGKKKKVQQRCKNKDQCRNGLYCRRANSQNSCFQGKKKRCCVREDDPCEDSCDCCGIDVICNGGFCQNA